MNAVAEGDEEFAEFMRAVYPSLLRTARLLTGDWHSAEDLVQAALVRVYLHWGNRESWRSPTAYSRTVTVNLFASWRRRRWMTERVGAEHVELPVDARGASDTDTRVALGSALAGLPRPQCAVLVLRFYEDLSVEECAAVLGCSAGTVKSRTNRAIQTLRGTGLFVSTEEGIHP